MATRMLDRLDASVNAKKGRLVSVSFGYMPGDDEQSEQDEFDYLVIKVPHDCGSYKARDILLM